MKIDPPFNQGRASRYQVVSGLLVALLLGAVPINAVASWPAMVYEIIFSAPAIGPHGEVVFGTTNGNADYPDGNVYSFSPDGSMKWRFEGTDWFESSPAIAKDGTVYIGGGDNKAEAKKLLEKAAGAEDPYFSDWAKRLLEKEF